jgi:YbgC/YbaW family acyl-CoA thioester hydrolase
VTDREAAARFRRPTAYTAHRRVELADTDLAGIAHFARFLVFMETAEHELLRSLGAEVHAEHGGARYGWPRVAVQCEYLRPVSFGQQLEIRVSLVRQGTTSLTFEHRILRGSELVAHGRMTSVCCRLDGPEGPAAVPIPAPLAERLGEASEPEPR